MSKPIITSFLVVSAGVGVLAVASTEGSSVATVAASIAGAMNSVGAANGSESAPAALGLGPSERRSQDKGVEAGRPEQSELPASDPCEELRTENQRLTAENAWLRAQLARVDVLSGKSQYEYFLASPDAARVVSDEDRKYLEGFLYDYPFYLNPGEATEIVRRWGPGSEDDGFEWFEANVVRFLGPDRVLREASPEWLESFAEFVDENQWQELFGSPPPEWVECAVWDE